MEIGLGGVLSCVTYIRYQVVRRAISLISWNLGTVGVDSCALRKGVVQPIRLMATARLIMTLKTARGREGGTGVRQRRWCVCDYFHSLCLTLQPKHAKRTREHTQGECVASSLS